VDAIERPYSGVPQSLIRLFYEGRDISRDVAAALVRLRVTDNLMDSSDDLDIELEDAKGLWRDAWYPGHGDALTLALGWQGQDVMAMGRFEIDEVELNYPPATLAIRALAVGIRSDLRTTQHRAYEGMTLEGIARQIAHRQGLGFAGAVEAISLERLTQETADLEFLRDLAAQYDHAFKIWDSKLVLQRISDLERLEPVARLTLTELANVRLRDSFREIPKSVSVKHQDAAKGKLVEMDVVNGEVVAVASSVKKSSESTGNAKRNPVEMTVVDGKAVAVPGSVRKTTSSGNTAKSTSRAASPATAAAQAKAKMAKLQRQRCTASWQCVGRPELKSGSIVELAGETAGRFAGRWLIMRATHSIECTSGFVTEVDACRVAQNPPGENQ